jgi:PAS domain S-box-containing protein
MNKKTPVAKDAGEEISAIIRQLHELEQRLQELTGGEVDAIVRPSGQSYLLQQAQEKLRQNEATQSSVLNALPAHIALLDRAGVIVSVNESWRQFAGDNALEDTASAVGQNYLEICERAHDNHAKEANEVAAGIRSVLGGASNKFSLEYPCHSPAKQRWFQLMVSPMNTGSGGAVIMHINITERKLAENAVHESEKRLILITNLVPHGIFAKDAAGRHIFANTALAEFAGLSVGEILGRTDFDMVADKAQAEAYRADDLAVIQSGREMIIPEEPRTDFSGRTRFLQTIKIPFTVPETGGPGVLGVCVDITERKLAEESLRESEERFRSMFTSAATGIAISTPDGHFLQVNAAYCQMLGYTEGELLKRDFASLTHPDDLAFNLKLRDEMLDGQRKSFVLEKRYIKKGGEIVWTRHSVSAIRSAGGRIERFIVIAENITERKRAEETLQKQQAELQVLFDLMPAMLCFKDTKNNFLRVNQRLADAAGASIAEIEGKPAAEIFPRDAAKYFADDLEVIQSRTAKLEIIEKFQSSDGKELWVHTDKVPVFDKDGNLTGIIVMVQDISERRLAENILRESEERFSSAFEFAPIGMALVAPNGRWLKVNRAICDIVGYSEAELHVRTFQEITHPDDLAADLEYFNRLSAGEIRFYEMEKRYIHARGHFVTIWLSVSLVRDAQHQPLYFIAQIQDITERKRAQEALVLFRTLIDQSSDSIEVVDPDTYRYLDVNESACTSHGYTRKEMLSMSVGDIDPDLTPALQERIERELKTAGRMVIDSRHQRKDGTIFPVEVTVKLVQLDKSYMVAMVRDITERKLAEEQLLWKTALLEAQVHSALDGIMVVDTEKKLILQNQRLNELWNTPEAFVIGNTSPQRLDIVTRQVKNRAQFMEKIDWLYEHPDEASRDEIELIDGKILDRYSAPVRGRDGKFYGRIWNFRDITERKRTEARFRRLVDSNAQGVIFWNMKGGITGANDAFLNLVGYTREDLEAGRMNWSAMTPPEYQQLDNNALKELAATGVCATFEKEFIRRDGTRVPILIGAATFEDNPDEGVAFVFDLTAHKKLEQQFRQSQKMEAIGQLASGVAHDFNNILAVIQIQADLLKTESGLSADALNFAREIGNAAQRAANLTRQLLLFSRKQTMQPRELDLSETINSMMHILRRTLGENIEMQFKFSMQSLYIFADPGMIDQVLLNLAVNARDAMNSSGKLIIETSAAEFDETTPAHSAQIRHGKFICLSVSDTGTGIAPENLSKIFDPFFTTKEVGKGTGLGLATVFGIVQQHQGWINVYSEPGHGATFRIYLPRLARVSDQKFMTPTTESGRGGKETILLVEDENTLRASVQTVLSRLGYRVLDAANGVEAIEVWKQHRAEIQLVLTDMVMPGGMGGKQLGEQLLKDNPKLKIIYASGYSAEVIDKNFPLKEGVNFLAKPFEMQKLAKIIRDNLDAPGQIANENSN